MSLDYSSEARLRAVAINAVREAMIVYGRADKQFTDDDAARIENIFQILHLLEVSQYEHAALGAEKQPEVAAASRKIADLLANFSSPDEPADSILETAPVAVSLPKAASKQAVANTATSPAA